MTRNNSTGRSGRTVDVVIVGAGHNGLVAGCYLARAGLDVLVVEASPTIGGMTSTNAIVPEAPDHLMNEGAIHATGIFRASTVAADLELHRYGLRELIVDPVHVHLDAEGNSIALWTDVRRTVDDIRRFSRRDANAWLELSRMLDTAMDVILPYMRSHPTRLSPREVLPALLRSARHPRRLVSLARLATASQAEFIDERFEHPLVRGVLAAMAAFSPMNLDGTAWALIYLGLIQRIHSAMFVGGTGALPAALHRCLLDHGGKVRTSARVEELTVRGGRVVGVRLEGGEEIGARHAVVTTCNPKLTLTRLLPAGTLADHLETRARHIPTDVSGATHFKINLALKGRLRLPKHEARRPDGLDLRKPLIAWHTLEEHVAGWQSVVRGEWPNPIPIGCATVPTATDPTQAPEGQDTFWCWSGVVPVHPKEPWETVRERVTKQVLDECAQYYEGIEELEIGRKVLCGPDIEERFNAPDGNVYHVDPVAQRFGPLRPALGFGAYKTPVPGLFLSGAGTHPTGGVCGIPGQLAARTVLRELGSGNGRRAWRARVRAGAGAAAAQPGADRGGADRVPARS